MGPALPRIADRRVWQAEIDELRAKEKAHARARDALAAERRLPMVAVDPQTPLIGAEGPVPLIDVFDGRSQLFAYFQMWHTGEPAAQQCEGCTFSTSQDGRPTAQWSRIHAGYSDDLNHQAHRRAR